MSTSTSNSFSNGQSNNNNNEKQKKANTMDLMASLMGGLTMVSSAQQEQEQQQARAGSHSAATVTTNSSASAFLYGNDNNNNMNVNEHDLFSDIPVDDELEHPITSSSTAAAAAAATKSQPTAITVTTTATITTPLTENTKAQGPAATTTSTTTPSSSSLLMQSGLLPTSTFMQTQTAGKNNSTKNNSTTSTNSSAMGGLLGGAGGGMFDDIDQQELQQQEEEEKRQQEQLLLQAEEEQRRRQQLEDEENERRRRQNEMEQERNRIMQQQQQPAQVPYEEGMQSIHLGNSMLVTGAATTTTTTPLPQDGFYRPLPGAMSPSTAGAAAIPARGGMGMQPPPHTLSSSLQQQPTLLPQQRGSITAGMHNGTRFGRSLGQAPQLPPIHEPPVVESMYGTVTISDPLLVQAATGLFGLMTAAGQAPHWSYQITTQMKAATAATTASPQPVFAPVVWMVRRRFRHVVALEERLRNECPGAILPPRPDKHATRALEEATTQQSVEFAMHRAQELEVYLNSLAQHPICHGSHVLRLFLGLQDDLGTAWPECSNNALTRLANASVGAAVKVSESTSTTKFPWQDSTALSAGQVLDDYGEDNAELITLQSAELLRMGAVQQAVPKLEGTVVLLRELSELVGAVGMELNRLAKEVATAGDAELGQPMEWLSAGLLRAGRRSKRLSTELSAALVTFVHHAKLCRYERWAMADRRAAIVRRTKERAKADARAKHLFLQQQQQQPYPYMQQQQPYGLQQQLPPPALQQQQPFAAPYPPLQQQPMPYGQPAAMSYGQPAPYGQPGMMMPPPQQGQVPVVPQQQLLYQPQFHPGNSNNNNFHAHDLDRLEREAVVSDVTAVDAVKECDEIGQRLKQEVNRLAWQRRTEWKAAVKVVASAMKEAASERKAIWLAVREQFCTAFPEYE